MIPRQILLLLFLAAACRALELQHVSSRRVDILVTDDSFPRVTGIRLCNGTCQRINDFVVDNNVITFNASLVGNLTVDFDVYAADGTLARQAAVDVELPPKGAEPYLLLNVGIEWYYAVGALFAGAMVLAALATIGTGFAPKLKRVLNEYRFDGSGEPARNTPATADVELARKIGHLKF